MSEQWEYQIRINLSPELARLARGENEDPVLKTLREALSRHGATLKCQYDAFADYVAEAEKQGTENYPLYKWTKATIEDPAKKEKYLKSFSIYVDADEVYPKEVAEALETDLRRLEQAGLIEKIAKYDTNPANSPQPPAHLR